MPKGLVESALEEARASLIVAKQLHSQGNDEAAEMAADFARRDLAFVRELEHTLTVLEILGVSHDTPNED